MRASPLRKLHQQAEASLAAYGPGEADLLVVETFGELELEYAALRKSCVLLDRPERAVLEVAGADRLEFLNRMVTQELKGFSAWEVRRSFWLNRKGRIDADLTLVELGTRTLVDVDALAAKRAVDGLSAFIITEDAAVVDVSEKLHRFSLHGPTAPALLAAASQPEPGAPAVHELPPDRATAVRILGHEVHVFRDDAAGVPGLELVVPAASALAIYQQLLEVGHDQHNGEGEGEPALGEPGAGFAAHAARGQARFRLRPAGWHAFNIARLEHATPVYNIDFGPESLPHEAGRRALEDRVSFTKGCYLGQEVVARMHSRGHSKHVLVPLRCASVPGPTPPMPEHSPPPQPLLPVRGAGVWPAGAPEGDAVGVVTSSTLSPMLGMTPIALAKVKPDHAAEGTPLLVEAEGQRIEAKVEAGSFVRPRDAKAS